MPHTMVCGLNKINTCKISRCLEHGKYYRYCDLFTYTNTHSFNNWMLIIILSVVLKIALSFFVQWKNMMKFILSIF